jgi:thiol-disulfide isomerase/thioredoxin
MSTAEDPAAADKNQDATQEVTDETTDEATDDTTTDQSADDVTDVTDDTTGETTPTDVDTGDDPTTDPTDETTDDTTTDPVDDTTDEVTDEPCEEGPTCKGAAWPEWSLEDFQPNSPRFSESYGLPAFEGTVTLMSLHAAWCGYCRTQAMHMDQMLQELRDEGYEVDFVTVNKINAAEEGYQRSMIYMLDDQNEIQHGEDGEPIYRCTYPLLQDVEELNVWEMHEGKKDDFYIYDVDGTLAQYLPSGTEFSTRLSTEEGYSNLKAVIVGVLTGEEPVFPESDSSSDPIPPQLP